MGKTKCSGRGRVLNSDKTYLKEERQRDLLN